jgi:multidrug efflux pump subunit AcrB
MANTLLLGQGGHAHAESGGSAARHRSRNPLRRFQERFEHRFSRVRNGYRALLLLALGRPRRFIAGFLAVVIVSFGLAPFLGENFFPAMDSGQILMRVRARPGTRIEETARLFDQVEQVVRRTIPPDQIDGIVDNIGLPYSGINAAYRGARLALHGSTPPMRKSSPIKGSRPPQRPGGLQEDRCAIRRASNLIGFRAIR